MFDILFDSGVDMNTTLRMRQLPSFSLLATSMKDGPFVGEPEMSDPTHTRGYDINEPRYMLESSGKVYADLQTAVFFFSDPASIMYLLDNKADPHFARGYVRVSTSPEGLPVFHLAHNDGGNMKETNVSRGMEKTYELPNGDSITVGNGRFRLPGISLPTVSHQAAFSKW